MNVQASTPKIKNVVQGEFTVSSDPSQILSTVLGSCIAACLSDPIAKVGGMNHFLLPGKKGDSGSQVKYGAYAMELLINEVMKRGGSRKNLVVKLFGGANITPALGDIGQKNIIFAKNFLEVEGIPCISESLGGNQARRIQFWPVSGDVKQRLVPREYVKELEFVAQKPVTAPNNILF